ncbi:MAG: hypothetical protein U0031_20640 [Thermomicrobiales bacterium]
MAQISPSAQQTPLQQTRFPPQPSSFSQGQLPKESHVVAVVQQLPLQQMVLQPEDAPLLTAL